MKTARAIGQLVIGSFINNAPAHASRLIRSFLVKHGITQVNQLPYSPDLTPCNFLLFPKLKWPLKGRRFQTIDEIQENTRQLMVNGKTVWGPKVPTLKGTQASLFYVQCSLYLISCIFLNKCLYFSYYMARYLLDRPHVTYMIKKN